MDTPEMYTYRHNLSLHDALPCDPFDESVGALVRDGGSGQSRAMTSLRSGLSFAVPWSRWTLAIRPSRSGKQSLWKWTRAPLGPTSSLTILALRQLSFVSMTLRRFSVGAGTLPKRSIISAAKDSMSWRFSSSFIRR